MTKVLIMSTHPVLSLTILLLMSALVLSGCGSSDTNDDGPDPVITDPVDELTDDERVSLAITSGDPSQLPDSALPILNRILSVIDTETAEVENVLQTIYGDNSIIYNVSRSSQFISFNQREGVYPLIKGNDGLNLAAVVNIEGQRNAAFGTNIIRSFYDGSYLEYENNFMGVLAWLLKRDSYDTNVSGALSETATIRLALMDNTTASRTTSWLNSTFENWDVVHCTDETELNSCIADADLIITGSNETASASIAQSALQGAQANGAALLYVHLHSWNTSEMTNPVLSVMNLAMQTPGSAGNYFSQDTANWDNYQQMNDTASDLQEVYQLVSQLKDNSFTFDLTQCATECDAAFTTEFKNVVLSLRSSMTAFDKNKVSIFDLDTHQLEKLLVLLGDFYRSEIIYPMDVANSEPSSFLHAYLADHLVYNSRAHNPVPSDLGDFSRTDFSHITPSDKTINVISKKNFRSAGVYALPGQTFTVTRNDSSDTTVSVFINTQRAASTHEFDSNSYNRPKFLQSPAVEIISGESIQLTSPYGGPVQLSFSTNDQPVNVHFSNIGEHPHWSGIEDNETFAAQMTAGNYDWAEVVTPHFEIHSQLTKMRSSLANVDFEGAEALAAGTEQYIHNYPHVLAGYQGPGIDVVAEIHDFANVKGWTIDNLDIVKHMNADQATCGYGCSGNPYDAYWDFNPIGHGDIHEFGHGLEKSKFRFANWDGHSTTNPYSYYSKTQYHALTETESSCQSLPFDDMYTTLQSSLKQDAPFAYMQAANLTGWNQGIAIYIQMMMAAQDQGTLIDGWHLLARLHILLREFERADNNEDAWLAARDGLGFGLFSLTEAKALNNNDWLVIAISVVTERDYRDFLTMWGLSHSDAAAAQVASFGFTAISKTFYQASSTDYCEGLNKPAVAISDRDGSESIGQP